MRVELVTEPRPRVSQPAASRPGQAQRPSRWSRGPPETVDEKPTGGEHQRTISQMRAKSHHHSAPLAHARTESGFARAQGKASDIAFPSLLMRLPCVCLRHTRAAARAWKRFFAAAARWTHLRTGRQLTAALEDMVYCNSAWRGAVSEGGDEAWHDRQSTGANFSMTFARLPLEKS
jgi:hypothetical protein